MTPRPPTSSILPPAANPHGRCTRCAGRRRSACISGANARVPRFGLSSVRRSARMLTREQDRGPNASLTVLFSGTGSKGGRGRSLATRKPRIRINPSVPDRRPVGEDEEGYASNLSRHFDPLALSFLPHSRSDTRPLPRGSKVIRALKHEAPWHGPCYW